VAEEYITKPWLNLDKDGHADILFVLPYEQRQFDENVLSNGDGKDLREAIEGTFSSFAVVTLKKTSGAWPDKNIESKVLDREPWLKRKIARYTPNVVVFMGVNMARYLIPEIKDKDAFDLVASFQRWKLDRNTEQLCFVYTQLSALYRDYEMRARIGENFAKLYAASKGRGYHLVGKYENLDYRHAKDFLKYCINDVKGYIAFDTETYSLNQVHNTRLGAMQFSLNTSESQIMLWDSDKSPYTKGEKEKLRKLLIELFSSKDTKLRGWIMHNAPFDMNQMRAEFDVRIPYEKIVRDTWIRTHLMDENRINRGEKFNLKQLSREMFGFIDYDREALEARSNGVIMDLPLKKFIKYAGNDPVCTFRLDKVIEIWAKIEGYYESLTQMTEILHNPALRLYSEMKVNGFAIDMQRLAELLAPNSVIRKRLLEIQQAYRTYPEILKVNEDLYKRNAGKTKLFRVPWIFDMNKPSFRNELFFHNKHGFQYPPNAEDKKTGKPKYTSGKTFQEAYAATNPIVALFHEAQGLSQMKKMYIQPIYEALSQGKHGDVSDMRVHPNFNMAGTVTGRLSSNNPNCFAHGTKIAVVKSHAGGLAYKNIEDIEVNDLVYCLNDEFEVVARRVLNKWNKGTKKTIVVTWSTPNGKSGSFEVTDKHRIKVAGDRWVKAGKLRVGDDLIWLNELTFEAEQARITNIRFGGLRTVWDIEVEEFHNFFAEGINSSNCQQIPRSDTPTKKAIKALFIAPKGRALVQADFAAAEVRMWGAMSKDKNLCELLQESFRKRGEYRKHPDNEDLKNAAELMGDVHKQTASLMFGVDLYGVDWKDKKYKDMRQTTKSITFGLMYGRGTQSVSAQINKTVEETDELKAKFFKRFSDGEAWLENQKKFARSHGYVETPLGRRRRFPQIFSGDKQLIKQAERWAVNAPIQATASDYAALATAMLQKYFVENDLTDKYKIVNAVHDSVVIEFPANADDMEFLAKLVRRIYTKDVKKVLADGFGFELMAPMDIDLEVSYNKYKKCKACGATHMMSENLCDNKVDTGKKDKDGKPIFAKCGGKKFSEEKLRYHAYGYLTELVETPEGFANAALGL